MDACKWTTSMSSLRMASPRPLWSVCPAPRVPARSAASRAPRLAVQSEPRRYVPARTPYANMNRQLASIRRSANSLPAVIPRDSYDTGGTHTPLHERSASHLHGSACAGVSGRAGRNGEDSGEDMTRRGTTGAARRVVHASVGPNTIDAGAGGERVRLRAPVGVAGGRNSGGGAERGTRVGALAWEDAWRASPRRLPQQRRAEARASRTSIEPVRLHTLAVSQLNARRRRRHATLIMPRSHCMRAPLDVPPAHASRRRQEYLSSRRNQEVRRNLHR